MTTFNTGNPLGSTDVYDRYDNSENLDNFSNGPLDAYPDRFGVSRQSMQGIRNASQYVDLGPYAAGLVFTSRNQVFSYLGEFYAPGPAITLPYTTTGAGAAEVAQFRSVGDAVLRGDLSSDSGAGFTNYKQPLAGAIRRAVSLKIVEHVSVRDFGAVGDGVTDDTLAIQAAFDSLASTFNGWVRDPSLPFYSSSTLDGSTARVHFPRGFYKITEEIAVPRGLLITGENGRNHGGSRIKQFGTGGKYCFNLYGVMAPNNQFIADQQIDGLFFSAVDGGGIRAFKPSGATEFYSPGSLSISNCFFLDMSGPLGTQYAAVDCDYLERLENNTFDAIEAIGLRAAQVSVCSGNTFFFNARGGIILDLSRSAEEQVPSTITGNAFIGCGGDGTGGTGPFQASLGIVGTGPASLYAKLNFSGNTISGFASGGAHGVVAENVILTGAYIVGNTFTNLKGDPIRLDAATDCTISNLNQANGDSSLGVYMLGVLGAAVRCNFIDNTFQSNAGLKNIHLGAGSAGNLFNGTVQDTDRFEAPAGYGSRINDFAGGVPSIISTGGATPWVAPSLVSSWVAFDEANTPLYRRNQNGEVLLGGSIKSGIIGNLAATLPVGFRPRGDVSFVVKAGAAAGSTGIITINNIGEVFVFGVSDSSNARVDLTPVRFPAEG